jgi:hypothetical protein
MLCFVSQFRNHFNIYTKKPYPKLKTCVNYISNPLLGITISIKYHRPLTYQKANSALLQFIILKQSIMKNPFLTLIAIIAFFGLIIAACGDPAQKVDDAQSKVSDAEAALEKAQQEYLVEVENYKVQTASTIRSNNEDITEFNARIEKQKKDLKAEYKLKIDALDKKNKEMEKKMAEYRSDNKDQWQSFKSEFNSDMAKLNQELRDLTKEAQQ